MRYQELLERVEIIPMDDIRTSRGSYGANRSKGLKLFVNPSARDLASLAATSKYRIRFSISTDGSLYLWSAFNAIHHDVLHHAGIDEQYGGYVQPGALMIRSDESPREMGPILRANKHILDMMGGVNFRVVRNTEEIDDY